MNYNQEQLNDLLIKSTRYGLVDLLKECLESGADPKSNDLYAIKRFVTTIDGKVEYVRDLIQVSNPEAFFSYLLYLAVENGHTECVKLLIPVSDPEVAENIKENYPSFY